jgi:hypothetical protein
MTAYVFKREQYWKYKYKDWTQPVLTANGTLGGTSFAVSSSSNYSGWPAWEAFDGVLTGNNGWSASSNSYPQHLIFYNAVKLWVKKLTVINNYEGNVAFTAGNVYGSNDGSSWTLITSYTNDNTTSGASWDIVLDGNKTLYKYHKLEVTKGNFISSNLIKCTEVLITAQTFEGIVKGTKDDYDFRADKAYVLKRKRPKEYRKTLINTATAGTYTFNVAKDRTAKIILIGGGGGGGQVWSSHAAGSGGGSGACVYIKAKLTAGTYTITNGAAGPVYSNPGGNSTLVKDGVTLIAANGGAGGGGGGNPPGNGGAYSISDNLEVIEKIIVGNGNRGTQGTLYTGGVGGASLYGGYGRGGNDRANGVAGYIFVELTTDETDYDYKIDNDACYVLRRKHYWKYEYKDWKQPVLTADGTIGGNSFATSQTSFTESGLEAFRAFDGDTSTKCFFTKSTGYLQWYNPNPLKITNLKLTNFVGDSWGTRALTAGSIQVSNNGSNFVELKTFTNSTTGGGASWNIDLSANTGYYKYYRIVCTETSYAVSNAANQCHISELKLTATEQITVKGTKDDYDFTTD